MASLYIYHFSTVIDLSTISTVVLLYTETPCTSREIYSEDVKDEARTRNPWITNRVLQQLRYTAQKLLPGRS